MLAGGLCVCMHLFAPIGEPWCPASAAGGRGDGWAQSTSVSPGLGALGAGRAGGWVGGVGRVGRACSSPGLHVSPYVHPDLTTELNCPLQIASCGRGAGT